MVLTITIRAVNFLNCSDIVREADVSLFPYRARKTEIFFPIKKRQTLKGVLSGEMSPELSYESRCFSVAVDGEGREADVDICQIASVDRAAAVEYASDVWNTAVWNTTEKVRKGDLKYLFESFYRADPSRNPQSGGYGVGLSIARAAARRGKITAFSGDGKSLGIIVSLPVKEGVG